MAKRSKKRCEELPILHPDAAGIDVGASELFVAVSADRDPQPVRSFPTFTRDLNALADWLQQCGVRSVAMESTSVYWIPVYQILESRGLEVCLVNAQHVKNVPGRKTDVSDCQWLQYLHSVGLLRASFRPPGFICQHHWVTESGDNIYLDPAVATTVPAQNSQTRFAIISYPSHITGGTGRFAGATGDVTYFGEADLVSGTALRYSGQVCFAEQD